ncbi:MAG: hypothetical protein CL566_01730 [Alphaproteobacteria bacterium]|nr:hypothetical protein [Alphaproteobacteria bacterium]
MLPHEIGGLVAGLTAPPATLFALAALTSRGRRFSDSLTDLRIQISRLERPHVRAEAGLAELGAQLEQHASVLEAAVANAQAQIRELGGGFGGEVTELEKISGTLRAQIVESNGAITAQAREADPDELLSASLLTADVGKTYLLLSRAVERHK